MAASPLRRLTNLFIGLLGALLFGFAAGATWMVPSMMFGRALPALALPVGWGLGYVVRRWLRFEGVPGALLAAGATLLASVYVGCLVAAATIAGMMGVGFAQSLADAGPAMLLSLAHLALGPADLALYLAGAVLAALVAWPLGRRRG
ncbi:hypothetical protein FIV34_05760 [Luteibacter pinisoli]|uniref:Vitamin B12 transport system permease protein n=1 Tax=Luteibacter pinisoli TaxID=2589080 RepID=A0A4Y5Z089_9GAMM|nr:hypothetical protein [Luteibacter pinisoli]QDE38740.1 hypothetical protein FIV34_05760 [Luteibacter pinisoli]